MEQVNQVSKQEFKNKLIFAVKEISLAIRDLKRVPSGHLYAVLMGKMDLELYNGIIQILKNAGLVKEESYELIWIGPEK